MSCHMQYMSVRILLAFQWMHFIESCCVFRIWCWLKLTMIYDTYKLLYFPAVPLHSFVPVTWFLPGIFLFARPLAFTSQFAFSQEVIAESLLWNRGLQTTARGGQIRSTKPYQPATKAFCQQWKNNIVAKNFMIWWHVTYPETAALRKMSDLWTVV